MAVFLSTGHNPKAVGACNGDFCEYPEAVVWVDRISEMLKDYGIEVVKVPTGTLGSKVRFINAHCQRGDIALEVHFNSNVKARGSETLYYPKSVRGMEFASLLQAFLAGTFQPDRGIKEGYHHGAGSTGRKLLYFLAKTNPVSLIIEPEFVYNKDKIIAKREQGCRAIAAACKTYLMDN